MLPQVEGDPAHDFGSDWIDYWTRSENYRIWDRNTDSHLFDIVEPKHPCAGGLTIDDVQRRMMEQVKEYGLDERFATGKEVLGRNVQAGREKASAVFNKLYADMEALREAQRKRNEEARLEAERNGTLHSPGFQRPDLHQAKQTVQSVGSKAGAYLGSWGTWAAEKKKGWGRSSSAQQVPKKNEVPVLPPVVVREKEVIRPSTQASFEEAIFDAELAAKHAVDGQITKIDLPMSPSSEFEGKTNSKFTESLNEVQATSSSTTIPSTSADTELATRMETVTVKDGKPITTEDAAEIGKRKQHIQDATATPISP
jgi:hypothetical protein